MARPIVRSLKGFTELGNNMRALSAEVNLKLARKAVGKAAQYVKRAVVRKAPQSDEPHQLKDVLVQPGNLKKNVIVKRLRDSELTAEYIVTVRGKKVAGYARRYGRLQEFGTVHMAPHPFMRPAFDESKQDAVEVMRTSLDVEIQKAATALPK